MQSPSAPSRLPLLLAMLLVLLSTGSVLAAPRRTTTPIRYIYVVPHSHLDIGFNYAVPDLIPLQKQFLDDAMDYAETYPTYHWTIESVWQLDQWLAQTSDPAQIQRLRDLMAQGKIELMAGYANMHQGLLGSEQFNRFLYPARAYEERWGIDLDTAISNDVPGSSWALPQVLSKNGVNNLVAGINTGFGGEPTIPVRDYLFNWQGVDGSEVLTWTSVNSYGEGIFNWRLTWAYRDMEQRTQEVIDYYERNGYPYDAVMMLLAFDNDGPDTILGNGLDNIERWNREHVSPQFVVSTPTAFFDHVRAVHGDDAFTTYTGDWSGLWENNDTTTPNSVAQNRWTQEALPQAESLAAIHSALDDRSPYPDAAFDQAYRDLLVWDEHSGPGGGYELTEEDIHQNNQWFRQRSVRSYNTARRELSRGVTGLAGRIESDRRSLVVYNPLSWPRSDLVTMPRRCAGCGPWQLVDLETGEAVPLQTGATGDTLAFLARDVPPLGYRLYGIQPAPAQPAAPVATQTDRIENEFYRVTVDPASGDLLSIYDKLNERELVDNTGDARFNRLIQAEQQNAVIWGAWQDVPTGAVQISAHVGPVQSQLTIVREQSPLRETVITLPHGLARVEIRNTLDHDRTAYADYLVHSNWYYVTMPFAMGESNFTGRFQGPNGWPVPQQDWIPGTQHNSRVVRHAADIRAADGFGVTVANRESYLGTFGSLPFWATGEPQAPVLFQNLFARADEAYTTDQGWVSFPTLEPGAPRTYTFNFALTSGGDSFDPVAAEQFGASFNSPLLVARIAGPQAGPFPGPSGALVRVSHPNVAVTTLKRAEFQNEGGDDLILRLRETGGQPATGVTVTLPFALQWAELNGLGEQRANAAPLPTDPLVVSLAPYETLTLRLQPVPPTR